jgi:hypothetical protein
MSLSNDTTRPRTYYQHSEREIQYFHEYNKHFDWFSRKINEYEFYHPIKSKVMVAIILIAGSLICFPMAPTIFIASCVAFLSLKRYNIKIKLKIQKDYNELYNRSIGLPKPSSRLDRPRERRASYYLSQT